MKHVAWQVLIDTFKYFDDQYLFHSMNRTVFEAWKREWFFYNIKFISFVCAYFPVISSYLEMLQHLLEFVISKFLNADTCINYTKKSFENISLRLSLKYCLFISFSMTIKEGIYFLTKILFLMLVFFFCNTVYPNDSGISSFCLTIIP